MRKRQIELSNAVAARARRHAGRGPARARGPCRLRRLPARQRHHARRRRRGRRGRRRPSCASSSDLIEQGHEIAPGTIDGGHRRARPARVARPRSSRTSSGATARRKVAPKTVNQKRYVDSIRRNTITFGIGPAGTGKTFLAVAMAAAALSAPRGQPHHPHAPRRRGRRAPGLPARRPDGEDRSLPAPAVRRAARHARPRARRASTSSAAQIEVAPLAFMRGRTLNDTFIILDEAQNTTPEQMKMFLTRLGFNSKMVVTGDITQIDLPTRPAAPASSSSARSSRGSRASSSSASAARTSCATGSCSGSSRPTTSTPSAQAPGAASGRAPACLRSRSSVEVLGAPMLRCPAEIERLVRARARVGGHRRRATSRSRSSSAERIAELNAEHRGKHGPTDVLSLPDRRRRAARRRRPARAGRHRHLPAAHRRPPRGRSSTARCT